MAIYRVHRKEWEYGQKPSSNKASKPLGASASPSATLPTTATTKNKRKNSLISEPEAFPGGGRKGVSSGLSVVVKHKHERAVDASGHNGWRDGHASKEARKTKAGWWKDLGGGRSISAKGSLHS
jgi:RNA exonuclease 4